MPAPFGMELDQVELGIDMLALPTVKATFRKRCTGIENRAGVAFADYASRGVEGAGVAQSIALHAVCAPTCRTTSAISSVTSSSAQLMVEEG